MNDTTTKTPLFDHIAAHGNRTFSAAKLTARSVRSENNITCADGFKLSVIAGDGTYCTPRPGLGPWLAGDDVPEGYEGPYTHVEVGYPSARPEPWHCTAWNDGYDRHEDHPVCDGWERYGDGESDIFSYVPVEVVRALILSHGGEK